MMWPFSKTKRHLKYASFWEWQEKEGVPNDWLKHKDEKLRDRWIEEYGELRQRLFNQHLKTLDAQEQRLFEENRHPSQSWGFDKQAVLYVESLKEQLNSTGIKYTEVCLGYYHMDRLILSVELEPRQDIDMKNLPWLHRGFEIRFYQPDDAEPKPSAEQSG